MDVNDIRRENINLLAELNGRAWLAHQLSYDDTNYLNQLCSGHGSFGRNTASKIETALNLGHGWMDQRHSAEEHLLVRQTLHVGRDPLDPYTRPVKPDTGQPPTQSLGTVEPTAHPPLTPAEQALLGNFRGMTKGQKDALLRSAEATKQQNDAVVNELSTGKDRAG